MPVQCARCIFGAGAWNAAPTYAFALYLGTDPQARQREAAAWAQEHVEACATAYCAACRQVCWLAREDGAQAALVQHTALLRVLAAERAHRTAGGGEA